MIALKIIYTANILVAGWISITSLFNPQKASLTVFQNTYPATEVIRLVGCLWGGIFLLSIAGFFYPKKMALILLFQLLYKGSWLVFVMLPAIWNKSPYPSGMGNFFIIWCLVLPFVIPWRDIFPIP